MARELTSKQKIFVREYLASQNATQSAIKAGYSAKNAGKIGPELLGQTRIAEEIKKVHDKRLEKLEIKADDVLAEMKKIAHIDLSQAFLESGEFKSIHDMPEDIRKAISGVEMGLSVDENGKPINVIKKIKFCDKQKSLEMLGRYLKLFTDKVETTGKDGKDLQPGVVVILPAKDE